MDNHEVSARFTVEGDIEDVFGETGYAYDLYRFQLKESFSGVDLPIPYIIKYNRRALDPEEVISRLEKLERINNGAR